MAITWASVTAIAPKLVSVEPGMQAAILAQVAAQVSPDAWGAGTDIGSVYLAAHIGTLAPKGGEAPAGPVTEQHAGPIGRQYAQPQGVKGDASLEATWYGREYKRLARIWVVAGMAVG